MRVFGLSLLALASVSILTVAAPRLTAAQPRVLPLADSQNAGKVEEAGYRYRYRYGYRPYYRRYGYYRPYYRPYYYRPYYGYRYPYYGYGYGYRPWWRPGIGFGIWF